MKFLIILTLLGRLSYPVFAQSDLESEINSQVWKPFIAAYNSGDHLAYMAVHSKDVLRITGRGMVTGPDYFERIARSFSSRKEGGTVNIKLYFEQRFHDEMTAYETGYYLVTFTNEDGPAEAFAGRFHVVLKKQESKWKIVQDYDTSIILGQLVSDMDFTHLPVME